MSKLRLTMSCGDYDRTRPLIDGTIQPEGIDLICLANPPPETFFRMLRHNEFDMCEMSLSSYVATLFHENPHFIAIPVFPSRFFRMSTVFINTEAGISVPKDLVGKRIGVPEYQMTAGVWIRGILSDEYGVPCDRVHYFQGGAEEPGRVEKIPLDLPPNIKLTHIDQNRTLKEMFINGELDALFFAISNNKNPHYRRLFVDFADEEREYFKKTRIFPIMHTFVLKRELYEEYPWVAQSMMKAFTAAKNLACRTMDDHGALKYTLPWLIDHVEKTRELMGDDYWPYGLEPNRKVLETFLRYSYEQGLSKRILAPEEIFAPASTESWKL